MRYPCTRGCPIRTSTPPAPGLRISGGPAILKVHTCQHMMNVNICGELATRRLRPLNLVQGIGLRVWGLGLRVWGTLQRPRLAWMLGVPKLSQDITRAPSRWCLGGVFWWRLGGVLRWSLGRCLARHHPSTLKQDTSRVSAGEANGPEQLHCGTLNRMRVQHRRSSYGCCQFLPPVWRAAGTLNSSAASIIFAYSFPAGDFKPLA